MDFNKWLREHAKGYEIRVIKGHCRNPEKSLSELRGHKVRVRSGYFSPKAKTFNEWLKKRGFTKYEIRVINDNCGKMEYIVYDVNFDRVPQIKFTKCIKENIDSFFETHFKQPLNKYYLWGCAVYDEVDIGYFHYGFQDYDDFEQRFNDILTILSNSRYDISTFQFFVVLYSEKRMIRLEEIEN